jgi:hypothetical protein
MMRNGYVADDGASRHRRMALAVAGELARGHVEERGGAGAQGRQRRGGIGRRAYGFEVETSECFMDEVAAAEDALVVLPALAAASELFDPMALQRFGK